MSIKNNYNLTLRASYVGYVVQAIVNNFAPLLYVTFNRDFDLSLAMISAIAAINFAVQLVTDGASAFFVDRIGYRKCVVAAHVLAAAGLILLGVLPYVMPSFVGIIIAIILYATGSGLIEVLISPIVEACPTERKEAAMTMLHSFYCWGQAIVIIVSTAFFAVFGVSAWRYMSFAWAILPLVNMVLFSVVPINTLGGENNKPVPIKDILRNPTFWILAVMMTAAGASEIAMCQWASAFTESGLGVSKTVGDIAGPCAFALLAGSARLIYAKFSTKINLVNFMGLSCALCTVSYLLSALSPSPVLALIGCALCGFSSGVLWPGIFSLAPRLCPSGMAIFALLALAGDLGCAIGPATIGFVSDIFGGDLRIGMLAAAVFPFIGFLALITLKAKEKKAI